MHEITIHKLDSAVPFHLTFTPLDSQGQPVHPTGTVQCVVSNPSVATTNPDGLSDHAQQRVTLGGVIGATDITMNDDLFTVIVHLIVDGGVETDATVIETP